MVVSILEREINGWKEKKKRLRKRKVVSQDLKEFIHTTVVFMFIVVTWKRMHYYDDTN